MDELTTNVRLRRLNRMTLLPPLAAVGVLVVVTDARTWWHVLLLTASVGAALLTVYRWTADRLDRIAVPCLAITAATWAIAAPLTDFRAGYYGLTVVGPIVVPHLLKHRIAALVALAAFVAGAGATRLTQGGDRGYTLIWSVVFPTAVVVVATLGNMTNVLYQRLILELEQSRAKETELAVARERIRFAGDLHDIQGHTLHVVKLKAALARRLVQQDPGRAEAELGEIQTLVGDTIRQTKELAYAQRKLNLSAELENAKNLFEAAGIRVRVRRTGEPGNGEMLGQVLRETTTNILRHAQATQVAVTLTATGITVVNDGAGAPADLRGLATLRERLVARGGDLTAEAADGTFTTTATLPEETR